MDTVEHVLLSPKETLQVGFRRENGTAGTLEISLPDLAKILDETDRQINNDRISLEEVFRNVGPTAITEIRLGPGEGGLGFELGLPDGRYVQFVMPSNASEATLQAACDMIGNGVKLAVEPVN